ncbi:MAG: hypothetical protein HeimC3_40500 [Candidatus Heimdallarchaeota archaeon LC_3]|nr:MAG: hypothetical protein HeimC3_40500 [Candidatus Heimdallarchaeota archaeon LC_3]
MTLLKVIKLKNNHMIIMIFPLLLLVFLPIFGFSQDCVFLIAIILMFGLHFLMMGSHNHEHQANNRNNIESKASDPLMENNNTTSHAKHDLHRKDKRR